VWLIKSRPQESAARPFALQIEAVKMFGTRFSFVFYLAVSADHRRQCRGLRRNLQAVYRRFCQEQGLARAFCADSALYARPANALSSKVFSEVVDLASGDVVQLVRTLPCHSAAIVSLIISSTCGMNAQSTLSPSGLFLSSFLICQSPRAT
jgi:hypothetical protein